jgi:hypothetical protein
MEVFILKGTHFSANDYMQYHGVQSQIEPTTFHIKSKKGDSHSVAAFATVHWPNRSRQNEQWIYSNPVTEARTLGCVCVLRGTARRPPVHSQCSCNHYPVLYLSLSSHAIPQTIVWSGHKRFRSPTISTTSFRLSFHAIYFQCWKTR